MNIVNKLKEIKAAYPSLDVVVGNIATARAARFLICLLYTSYFKQYSVFSYLLIFAHESLSVTVRLNTRCSGVESVSGQK